MKVHDARRRPDGSIDIDFYRAGAAALRRRAMCDARQLRTAVASMLATAAVLALTVGVAIPPMTRSIVQAVAQADTSSIR
jgi:hypothetical protein